MTSSTTIGSRYAADRWNALGTYVSLVVADADKLAAARSACEQILAGIDLACSRFRDDSDLVRANRNAGRWVQVDPLLVQAMTAAVRVAHSTDGLVDPTLGGHLAALGYDRDLDEVRRAPRAAGAVPPVVPDSWRRIGIDPDGGLRVPEGVSLDLGATGKAFAADLIAATVPDRIGTALIISLGGDVAVGTPTEAGAAGTPGHRWQIAVAERPEDVEAELVVLDEGGLATSSTLARHWSQDGVAMHHLLDPRTGLPVEPVWRTVSVCADSCLDANAASTAAIVLGRRAPAWLWQADLAARLVAADGEVFRIAGWPEPALEPATADSSGADSAAADSSGAESPGADSAGAAR
jgi:thiamine biosynthesis lipoprotein